MAQSTSDRKWGERKPWKYYPAIEGPGNPSWEARNPPRWGDLSKKPGLPEVPPTKPVPPRWPGPRIPSRKPVYPGKPGFPPRKPGFPPRIGEFKRKYGNIMPKTGSTVVQQRRKRLMGAIKSIKG